MKYPTAILKKVMLVFTFTTISGLNILLAQDEKQQKQNDKEEAFKKLVTSQEYIFVAQSASPMSGRVRQLTSTNELKITPDTISADLPYFGRAYTAPIDGGEGGIHFKTKNFEYTIKDRKKGGWDVNINIKDQIDSRQLMLYISKAGYSTLQVTSTNRQPISFSGYIKEIKK